MDDIAIEPVQGPTDEVRLLIRELDQTLAAEYLPEQRHGLALDAIFRPGVRFFLGRLGQDAVGCGGIELFAGFAEVKRMYVREAARGRGVAHRLLARLETEALEAGLPVLRLETGSHQFAALRLYTAAGFKTCPAFGAYSAMPAPSIAESIFMEKRLHSSTGPAERPPPNPPPQAGEG